MFDEDLITRTVLEDDEMDEDADDDFDMGDESFEDDDDGPSFDDEE